MTALVEPALASDFPAVCALLVQAELPTAGLERHLASALVARVGNEVVECAAVEFYGGAALVLDLIA